MAEISEAEKQRRRQINRSVLGTNAMEGLQADEETLRLMKLYEEGQLSREQLSAGIDRHVSRLVASTQTVAGAA